jgi:ppGpp synthetase/RelA/SpoT-type nucleotidyltranferase
VESGEQIRERYEARCEVLCDLGPVAQHLAEELVRAKDIRVHSVTHRIKTSESVQRKLGQKATQYEGIDDIHDLLGLRIITFFPDEVDLVAGVIEAEFKIDPQNSVDKRALLDPDRFGYLSRHYVAELNGQRTTLLEHSRFSGAKFEIQIRSILQHAWAEIEHDLGYHTVGAVPAQIRRRFSRLAGLLEMADDEFQALREASQAYQLEVGAEIDRSPESVQIDRDSVDALIQRNVLLQELDRDVATALETSIIFDSDGLPSAGSNASRLSFLGFTTIGEVEQALTANEQVIRAFSRRWAGRITGREIGGVYPGISLFYLAYVLVADSGSEESVTRYLEDFNIGSVQGPHSNIAQLAQEVLRVAAEARNDSDTDAGDVSESP